MMRIVDIIYSLPDMLIIILLSVVLDATLSKVIQGTVLAKLGTNMLSIFIVFGLLYWVGMARLVRGQILSIKQNEYVLAARALGAKPGRIIKKHILPNCISVIFISTALQVPSAIFTESFLSFVGLGVAAPMPSLGSLANRRPRGAAELSLQACVPGGDDLSHRTRLQSAGRRPPGRLRPKAQGVTGMGKILEVKNLRTSFFTDAGEAVAVNGISFGLDRGEVLGIVGESGSGKSVTAYSILRILTDPGRIVGGEILYKGRDVTKFNKHELQAYRGANVSIVFQDPMTSLNPVYTIGNQLCEAVLLQTDRTKQQAVSGRSRCSRSWA
jgi:ABC-type multidrug transport system fused ATPase/permease subunit